MRKRYEGPTKEVATCTAPVRWTKNGLQQKWHVATVTDGHGSIGLVLSERYEWRDVPTVDGQDVNETK